MPRSSDATFAAFFLLLVPACGDDGGVAPVIRDLTFTPASVPTGQTTTVSGGFQFTDDDGDVTQLAMAVTPPGGAAQQVPPTPIQNVAGLAAGAVTWAVQLTPPGAGSYLLDVTVIDADGHVSNPLTATVTAP